MPQTRGHLAPTGLCRGEVILPGEEKRLFFHLGELPDTVFLGHVFSVISSTFLEMVLNKFLFLTNIIINSFS